MSEKEDLINNPSHYHKHAVQITVEPIDLCETCGFLLGNAFKYLFRFRDKGNPVQDLEKAEYYLKRHLAHTIFEDSLAITIKPNKRLLKIFSYNEFISLYLANTSEEDRILAILNKISKIKKQYV